MKPSTRKPLLGSPPNLSRVDVQSTIRESSDLLQEVKSWHKELERNSSARIPPTIKPQESFSIKSKTPEPSRKVSAVAERRPNLMNQIQGKPQLDVGGLRSDIENLRKEVKHLSKKMLKNNEKKSLKVKKIKSLGKEQKENKISSAPLEKSPSPSAVLTQSKNLTVVYQHEPSLTSNPKLAVHTLQDFYIRRALTVQQGPKVAITGQPAIERQNNVHFSAVERLSESPVPATYNQPPQIIKMQDEQVSTEVVQVSSTSCQTSPPKLVNIFAQTEQITISKVETRMISVAVQSSPELTRVVKADLEVQTERVQLRTVATETAAAVTEPEIDDPLKEKQEVNAQIETIIGPAGDIFPEPNEVLPESKPGNLSPIIEVASSNISPDIFSPLTSPKVQLTIPETSKSDNSASPVTPEKNPPKGGSPPKAVAFADLPLLLRLRSPSMKFKIPNYRSKWRGHADSSPTTTDDECETVTRSNEPETSEIQSSSDSRSTSPISTSSITFTESSGIYQAKKAMPTIPDYQRKRIRALAAKVAPNLLRHDDGEISEGQVWPL